MRKIISIFIAVAFFCTQCKKSINLPPPPGVSADIDGKRVPFYITYVQKDANALHFSATADTVTLTPLINFVLFSSDSLRVGP